MKSIFKPGDHKEFKRTVSSQDFARFNGEVVHPVFSTFGLARDMEWTTRQFVLEMRDEDEEGIGTFVHVDHRGPAFEHEEITFRGSVTEVKGHELICSVDAFVGDRLIASGKTGQKILKKEKLDKLFSVK
ncbi:MAG TPA: hypothetical protein VD927_04525 [Chryseosolibacter sp.]|nr:hypothetical protein [Chryseosolibacter sp.]